MYLNSSKEGWKQRLVTYTFVLLSSLIAYGYSFQRVNIYNQIPSIFSLLDPELYKNDFYIQEMIRFTPRFYYYSLIYLPTKLGLSVPAVCFFYYALAFFSFILGLYSLGQYLGNSKLSGAILAFLGLAVSSGTVGSVDIFRLEPIPSTFAMGITVWGLYFCFRKQWILGYLFFGIACLLQFLVGLLPACLLTPSLMLYVTRNKCIRIAVLSFLTLGILASLVYVPMVITGNTSSGEIGNQEFVYLYGYIRHPWHIIFSTFSGEKWRNFIIFMGGGILCIKTSNSLKSEDKCNLILIIATSIFLLLLSYIFVELYPLSFFAKLQLARTTPFALIAVLIAVSVLVDEYYRKGNIALCLFLIIVPIMDNFGGLALAFRIVAIGLLVSNLLIPKIALKNRQVRIKIGKFSKTINSKLNSRKGRLVLYSIFLIFLVVSYYAFPILLFSLSFPFLEKEFPEFYRKSSRVIRPLIAIFLIFLTLQVTGVLSHSSLTPLQRDIKIYPQADESISKLALRFRQHSSKDAIVLVPPSDKRFRFYAERAVVVTFKSFPFTDQGIREWRNRLEALLGPLHPSMSSTAHLELLFSERSSSDLVDLAKRFGASYILTQVDWHPDIEGAVADRESEWILWRLR